MIYILYILLGITLFQDVKYRGVHWSVFLLLLASAVIYRSGLIWANVGYNLIFITLLMSALTLYLSLKQGHIVVITRGFFSWGDILFLVVLAPLFEWRSYLIFFTFGTICVLLVHGIVHLFKHQESVPYAGYLAPFAGIFLWFQNEFEFFFQQL